jgi:hypothetical protein
MDSKELKKIAKTMKALGITHLKTAEFELTMAADTNVPAPKVETKPIPVVPLEKSLSPEEEAKIVHKVEELKSIMQLGDMELLDRMFPDHTQYPDSDEVTQ